MVVMSFALWHGIELLWHLMHKAQILKQYNVIVTNYTHHNLIGIDIYGLVVIYLEKCPCW
jgi:hypothetical protein